MKLDYLPILEKEGEKKQLMKFQEGTTISQVIEALDIDEKEVSIALVNGMDGSLDREIKDGDIIALFPPVGGG